MNVSDADPSSDEEMRSDPSLGPVMHSPVEAGALATSITKASDRKGFYFKESIFATFFSEHQINMEFEIGSRRRNINILQVSPVF